MRILTCSNVTTPLSTCPLVTGPFGGGRRAGLWEREPRGDRGPVVAVTIFQEVIHLFMYYYLQMDIFL